MFSVSRLSAHCSLRLSGVDSRDSVGAPSGESALSVAGNYRAALWSGQVESSADRDAVPWFLLRAKRLFKSFAQRALRAWFGGHFSA